MAPRATVIGPVPATVPPGHPGHDYSFFATQFDLAGRCYIEEEFFLEGVAASYHVVPGQCTTATEADGSHPYRTRMVVRRPVDPGAFNGTVVVEWYNVTMGLDIEADWFRYYDGIMRGGYAWVGVSAQAAGVNSGPFALRTWSPHRYGTLDVTAGGSITDDSLSFDIYSQALQAIRCPVGTAPLGDLTARRVIADGESQSASRLVSYYNAVHPLAGLADAFIVNGPFAPHCVVRTDLDTPVFKFLTETDVAVTGNAQNRQPDSDVLRTWEVAGTAHIDFDVLGQDLAPTAPGINPVQWRDTGTFQEWDACDLPTLPRTPYRYVYHAVLEHVDRWIESGTAPPRADPLTVASLSGGPRGAELDRDEFGIARGGIRLADVDVPTATNASPNNPGFACSIFGQYQPFARELIDRLYPSHQEYVSRVEQVTDQNVEAGYLLGVDGQAIKDEAARSAISGQEIRP